MAERFITGTYYDGVQHVVVGTINEGEIWWEPFSYCLKARTDGPTRHEYPITCFFCLSGANSYGAH